MRSKEEEFGVLVVESDGAGSKEREDACNSEDGVKRCSINVGILSEQEISGGGVILRCGVSGLAYRQVGGERK